MEDAKVNEPCFDVAHLGHVEVYTDRFEESPDFFTRVYGLKVSAVEGDSAFLRAWDDYEFHTLKLTRHHTTGVGHIAYRTSSPQALERRVAAIRAAGYEGAWTDGDLGHGPAFRVRAPSGHLFELYWETRRCDPPPEDRPALKNMASRFHAVGACPRRIDHVNILAPEVEPVREFMTVAPGARVSEYVRDDDGRLAGCWFTVDNKTYDLACAADHTGARGRLHHVTCAADQREDILRAADIFLENGVRIETGPHRHAIQGTFFLYVFEPAGNRVELANAGARLLLAPDWEPVMWTQAERARGQAWGLPTVPTFHTWGTPPVPGQEEPSGR